MAELLDRDTRTPSGGMAPQTADAMILTLTRSCCGDARLREIAGEERIAAVVEETVHDLWGRSAVKAFIPVLAMRQVRAALGAAG